MIKNQKNQLKVKDQQILMITLYYFKTNKNSGRYQYAMASEVSNNSCQRCDRNQKIVPESLLKPILVRSSFRREAPYTDYFVLTENLCSFSTEPLVRRFSNDFGTPYTWVFTCRRWRVPRHWSCHWNTIWRQPVAMVINQKQIGSISCIQQIQSSVNKKKRI